MPSLDVPTRKAIKCCNCRCIYGCRLSKTKFYCIDCVKESREICMICVDEVDGGLCASCLELSRIRRGDANNRTEKKSGRRNSRKVR
jgi:hypothetical protein